MSALKVAGGHLTPEQHKMLDYIKHFYGFRSNSETFRFLIQQEARRIEAARAALHANAPASP